MTSTADRFHRAEALLPANALRHVYDWFLVPRWDSADAMFWYRIRRRSGWEFVRVDPASGSKAAAFDHMALARALTDELGHLVTPGDLPFRDITLAAEDIHFSLPEGDFSFGPKGLRKVAHGIPPGALLSPDGRQALLRCGHNLDLITLETSARRALTTDGLPHHAWGAEPGGTMDALSAATQMPAADWSPCGRWILVFRCDERAVAEMPILDTVPSAGGRPAARRIRVPLIGDPVTETASYWVIDTHSGGTVKVQMAPFAAMESPFWFRRTGMPVQQFWTNDSQLFLTRRSAGGREQVLYKVDPASGAACELIREASVTPVFLNPFEFGRPNWRIIETTGEILWYSERDGRGQLYLHDAQGHLIACVGPGDHIVRDVLHVDPQQRKVWFTAGGVERGQNPYHRHLLCAALDGGPAEVLANEEAEHLLWATPCGGWFVDLWGRPDLPSTAVLRNRDGRVTLTLEQADAVDLDAIGFRPPQPFVTTAADGQTLIHGALYLPQDFDPAKSYPVLDAIYGWSQVTVVPHGFLLDTGAPVDGGIEIGAENFFMPAATAALGFVVVVIDGRGTPYRDRAFHDPAFSDPALATGLADHVAALRELAQDRPWMDMDRVGVFGHSGGGHMAVKAMLLYPDLFKAAVASAGSHDMALYHAAWADLWGLNPEALATSAVPPLARHLQGHLMLAHGNLDENVHIAHSLRLVDALIRADKDFDLMILPGRHHDFTLDPYFLRRRWDFLLRHLAGAHWPADHIITPGDWSLVA
jgi:dipeptidyl aminopeptidase/acylaminoacyl peptidase